MTSVEDQIIRLSVERAVVRAMAEVTIEDLLKRSAVPRARWPAGPKQFAEAARPTGLGHPDRATGHGRSRAPINLYNEFAAVNSAVERQRQA